MSERRWRIHLQVGADAPRVVGVDHAPGYLSVAESVEVMPVAEHERLREAAQAVVGLVDAGCADDAQFAASVDALRAALDGEGERVESTEGE